MAFLPGTRLGPYEVVAPLGAGGMGEVYRARDTRLGREVAIKVLPAERMADEGRKRRFVQEARAASALNHPNIVTIHEIESAEGVDFIVMEYVPGQTLNSLIPKHGMKLGEAFRVAIPIADALACAHARGIVHRDLKPANVIVTREGVVKVLDFGLAKLVADETEDTGETLTTASVSGELTRPGVVTGTAGYMSPEQATGGKVDARSDVFSFGAVLYEMVTGRRAFSGKTVSETLTAVVRDQPKAPRELVPGIPQALERLILLCLRKEPERRFQHMSDVKVELQEVREQSGSTPTVPTSRMRRKRGLRLVASLVGALALATGGLFLWRSRRPERPAPYLVPLTATPGPEMYPTFSPDGNQIAFAWSGEKGDNWDIYVKMIGSTESHRLTTDPAADSYPAWSPDGRLIAFVRVAGGSVTGSIHVVSPLGGSDRKLSDQPVAVAPLSWSPDSLRLATGTRMQAIDARGHLPRGIRLIDVSNGEARPITTPDGSAFHAGPTFSPDGRHLAYASCPGAFSCWIDVVGVGRDYLPNAAARRLTRRMVHGMGYGPGLAWTRDGRSVVYSGFFTGSRLWRVGIAGDAPPERIEVAGFGAVAPAVALSGERLAFTRHLDNSDVFRLQAGRPPEVVAASNLLDWNPALSPDGTRFAFESGRGGGGGEIWLADGDGSNSTQLTRGPGVSQGSPCWSPDGRRIAFDSLEEEGQYHVWTIDAGGGSLRRLTSDTADENMPTWSQDGRFIYFSRGPSGRQTIWRAPATGGPAEQVTRTGGGRSELSADGRTLYFQRDMFGESPLLVVSLDGGPERTVISCARRFGYAVTVAGVYYQACGRSSAVPLLLLDPATGRERQLGTLEGPLASGLTVSADGKTILFARWVNRGSDLVLIENFR